MIAKQYVFHKRLLHNKICLLSLPSLTGWHASDDVRISRVCDGHCAHSEVFTTGCAQFNVVACVVVNSSLGQHGIVFNLRFPARQFIFTLVQKLNPIWFPGDKDSIDRRGLLLSLYLRGGVLLAMITNLDFPWRRVLRVWRKPRQYLPDFITKDRRELILSTAFFCNK